MWRNPLPYSANLTEGDIGYFNGYTGFLSKLDGSSVEQYGRLLCGNYDVVTPGVPQFDGTLQARAEIKALSNLKNQKVNLAVAFGERKETAKLVAGTLQGLAKAARSLRKRDVRGVAEGLGLVGKGRTRPTLDRLGRTVAPPHGDPFGSNFHQKWLELQYGWRPLYQDVYGVVQALHEKDTEDPKRYSTAVKATLRQDVLNIFDKRVAYTCTTRSRRIVAKEFCMVRLDYYLENPLLQTLSQLGITNPGEVAWELVPFSFVADWFTPIGSWLGSMDAALGWRFRTGSLSRKITQEFEYWLNPTTDRYYTSLGAYGSGSSRSLRFDRIVYSSTPWPRFPGFKNPLDHSGQHLANALALFSSALAGKKVSGRTGF